MGLSSTTAAMREYVCAVSTSLAPETKEVLMTCLASIHLAEMPMLASLVAMMRLDSSSPVPWMASRLATLSSPSRYTPCAMARRESISLSQVSMASSCFSIGSRSRIMLWCTSRSRSIMESYSLSRAAALRPISIRLLVQPLMAENTTTVRSCSTAADTMSVTLLIIAASATEVPPNLSTCISLVMSFAVGRPPLYVPSQNL